MYLIEIKLIYLYLGFWSLCPLPQSTNAFLESINNYISNEKSTSIRKGLYNVYVLNMYEYDSKSEYCVSVGVIKNSFALRDITPIYFVEYKNEIIIIKTNNKNVNLKCVDWNSLGLLNVNIIDDEKEKFIYNKLCPNQDGMFISGHSGIVTFCNESNNFQKEIFESEVLVSPLQSIYNNYSQNIFLNSVKQVDTIKMKHKHR